MMWWFRHGLLAAALAIAPLAAHAEDLFHTLQRNSWYMPTTDQTAQIFVTSLGKGPRVVVLHGGFGANFEYMVRAVEPHIGYHQFILFDQRGSLLSPYRGKMTDLTIDDLVDDLELLRVQLGEERLTLLGHSMGTRLAMEYAHRYPGRVGKLILLGSLPPRMASAAEHDAWQARSARFGQAMIDRPEMVAIRTGPDLALPVSSEERAAATTPEQIRELDTAVASRLAAATGGYERETGRWRAGFAAVNLARVERWREFEGGRAYFNLAIGEALDTEALKTWNLPQSLQGRRVPISIIQGDQDYVDPSSATWRAPGIAEALGTCLSVATIERAGHVAWIDDPAVFHGLLATALARAGC